MVVSGPATELMTLHNASVSFGEVQALRDATLTLRRGERLILIGANGSGKTTLLRLMHGLIGGTGTRTQASLPETGRPPVAAMVFQKPFAMNLSVRANVLLGPWLGGVARRERVARRRTRCAAWAARSGATPARALSGGQQQRMALARAWVMRPDLLFLDEPTASLDPGAKREVEAVIEAFGRDGVTIVMSTHNLGQARRLGTRMIYLEGGRIVVDLPVERFFTDELPAVAAQFLKGELGWR